MRVRRGSDHHHHTMGGFLQPYDDVPGIQEMDDALYSGPQWVNMDPSLEQIVSREGYSTTNTWYMQQRLNDLQQSVNGFGHPGALQIPDQKLSRFGFQSQWDADSPDKYRHMRYLSPGGAYGATSATDSCISDECHSPEAIRHFPTLSRVPSMGQRDYSSSMAGTSFTAGNGMWMSQQQAIYSTAAPSSSYAPSEHSSCTNPKDLQYLQDVDVEEERPSALPDHSHRLLLMQPEEVAFADEALGPSIQDEDSIRSSDSDSEMDEETQPSDVDSEYSPNHKRKQSLSQLTHSRAGNGAGRGSPRRTRSLNTSSPILSSHNHAHRVTKPGHRRTSSNAAKKLDSSPAWNSKKSGGGGAGTKSFPCTFDAYGCASVFASKNEWKRHVASQHLQLGFYRCDTGFCNPANASPKSSGGGGGARSSYNDFNRKDLFTQHHRRMHLPWAGKYEAAPEAKKAEFERGMDAVRDRCWVVRREKPTHASCGVCGAEFAGENAWDERMEHVGKHFERGEGVGSSSAVREDEWLTEWALREGLVVRRSDGKGFLLVGLEGTDGSDVVATSVNVSSKQGIVGRGRRARATAAANAANAATAAHVSVKDEDDNDGEGEQASESMDEDDE